MVRLEIDKDGAILNPVTLKGAVEGEAFGAAGVWPDGAAKSFTNAGERLKIPGEVMAAAIAGQATGVRVTFYRGTRSRRLRLVGIDQVRAQRFLILDEEG